MSRGVTADRQPPLRRNTNPGSCQNIPPRGRADTTHISKSPCADFWRFSVCAKWFALFVFNVALYPNLPCACHCSVPLNFLPQPGREAEWGTVTS